MPTKYLACDPNVGSDGNSGDSEKDPWLTLQVSIDKMVKARTNPTETCILMIMNYQVDETALLKGQSHSNFQFIGTTPPNVSNDPHQEVLFCEPRPRMWSPNPDKPVFRIEDADDIKIENLVLFNSHRGVEALNAKNVQIVKCCIHHNKAKRGSGFLLEKCTGPLVDTCRVWSNEATEDDGGGGAFDKCEGAIVKKSFFFLNNAKKVGGALSFRDCTHEIAIDANDFGDKKVDHNTAKQGGAVAAEGCEKLAFGLAVGRNSYKWNNASDIGGAVLLELCHNVVIRRDWYSDNSAIDSGGAISSKGSDLTVHEAEIQHNQAREGGGIKAAPGYDAQMKTVTGGLALYGCLVRKNEARGSGGGVFAFALSVTIEGGSFYDENQAKHGGGFFFLADSDGDQPLDIRKTTFVDNRASSAGGGAEIEGGKHVSIKQCTFESNKTDYGALNYMGSGKSNYKIELHDCRFQSNEGTDAGAASFVDALAGSIQNNRILDNQASDCAGFLFLRSAVGQLGFTTNEFQGNSKGPDIVDWNDAGNPQMTKSTLEQDNTVNKLVPNAVVK